MGIYYQAMDHKNKEVIKPPHKFSIKFPGIINPNNPFSNMVILANAIGGEFEIVNDGNEDIFYDEDYTDVTDEYFEMLKKYFPNYDFDKAQWIG